MPIPPHERVLRRIEITENDCWRFQGMHDPDGYGRIGIGFSGDNSRRVRLCHRVVYEALVGPIPEGLVIDHLCRVRDCVNPAHMEPVTSRENTQRGISAKREVTHCPQGHPYAGDNLEIISTTGARKCKTCRREQGRRYYARNIEKMRAKDRARAKDRWQKELQRRASP